MIQLLNTGVPLALAARFFFVFMGVSALAVFQMVPWGIKVVSRAVPVVLQVFSRLLSSSYRGVSRGSSSAPGVLMEYSTGLQRHSRVFQVFSRGCRSIPERFGKFQGISKAFQRFPRGVRFRRHSRRFRSIRLFQGFLLVFQRVSGAFKWVSRSFKGVSGDFSECQGCSSSSGTPNNHKGVQGVSGMFQGLSLSYRSVS